MEHVTAEGENHEGDTGFFMLSFMIVFYLIIKNLIESSVLEGFKLLFKNLLKYVFKILNIFR